MSNHRTSSETRPALQRADAERILRRAVEIDTHGGEWITADELRRIAIEADVDPRSLDRALAEAAPASLPAPSPSPLQIDLPPARPARAERRALGETLVTLGVAVVMLGLVATVLGVGILLVGAMLDTAGARALANRVVPVGGWIALAGMLVLTVVGVPLRTIFPDGPPER